MLLDDRDLAWLRQFEGFEYAVENSGRYADTLHLARGYVGAGTAVVDLGLYPGHLALLLKQKLGAAVTGLSYAHTVSFSSRMHQEGITVHEADITRDDPPLPAGSFDVALCTEIIEHLDRPLPLLVRANRLLRPGGALILSTPNHAALKCRLSLLAGRPAFGHLFGTRHVYQMSEWVHRREYTAGELRRLLEPVGFQIEATRYSSLKQPPWNPRARLKNLAKSAISLAPALKGGIILAARKTFEAVYTSRVPDLLRAAVSPTTATLATKTGQATALAVDVSNTGTSTWLIDEQPGYGFVRLGGHLRDREDRLVDFDFFRCPLPHDVPPGATVRLPVQFDAPREPGRYVLELDLVNEGVSWFHNYGSPTATVALLVAPRGLGNQREQDLDSRGPAVPG